MKAMDTGTAVKRERPVVSIVEVLLRVAVVGGRHWGSSHWPAGEEMHS